MTITKEGAIASFYTVNKAPIKHLKVYFSPKQAGSGNASPENVREISGHSSIQVHTSGKNLVRFPIMTRTATGITWTTHTDGSIDVDGTASSQYAFMSKWTITNEHLDFYLKAGTYKFSGNHPKLASLYLVARDGSTNKDIGQISSSGTYSTFTITQDTLVGLQAAVLQSTGEVHFTFRPQLELISVTQHEKPTYNTYNITFPSIIYGGYIDLITGELVQEQIGKTFKGSDADQIIEYTNTTRRRFRFYKILKGNGETKAGITYCDKLRYQYNENDTLHYFFTDNNSNGNVYAYLPKDFGDNDEITFVASLYTPELVATLSPIELQSFIGQNNIWSNATKVEVEYDLAESNDELYRRRNIILNSPHIESASGAIASFNTDMKAPIVDLKAYFTPMQEGTGDPSPQNERPIRGWTGLSLFETGINLFDVDASEKDPDNTSYSNSSKRIFTPFTYCKGASYSNYFNRDNVTTFAKSGSGFQLLSRAGYGVGFAFPLKAGATYRCRFTRSNGGIVDVAFYAKDGTYIGYQNSVENTAVTVPSNAEISVFVFRSTSADVTTILTNLYLCKDGDMSSYDSHSDELVIPVEFPATKNLFKCIESEVINAGWNRYIPNPIKQPGTYTISCTYDGDFGGTGSKGVAFSFTDSSYQRVGNLICGYEFGTGTSRKRTFTVTSEQVQAPYIGIWPNSNGLAYSDIVDSIQIETGSYATGFEPYGTAYGGYIDLIRGKFVLEYYRGLVKSASGKLGNFFYNVTSNIGMPAIADTNSGLYADRLPNEANVSEVATNQSITIYQNQIMRWIEEDYIESSLSDYNAYLAEHPFEIVYRMKYPIEYDLTPEQIKTLKGTNNIWSDANGNIEVKYWTH